MIKLIKIIYFIILSFYFLFFPNVNAQEKIKIGLLVPMTGENKEIGESIIKAVGLAVKDIDNDLIEIYPKDTATKANQTLKSAFELSEMGIKIVIGPGPITIFIPISLCLLYTSPSPRDQRGSRMPSSA